ncbi:hypothetical protein Q5P01_004755 [Channa striata]|uniref:Uncharacterized protein n=1 Tax=Channa striata TaxID=64152 RepID=A0AA88NMA0_CHASR|nr:hypothetical protein Q5P01_004755 [Channa striata]
MSCNISKCVNIFQQLQRIETCDVSGDKVVIIPDIPLVACQPSCLSPVEEGNEKVECESHRLISGPTLIPELKSKHPCINYCMCLETRSSQLVLGSQKLSNLGCQLSVSKLLLPIYRTHQLSTAHSSAVLQIAGDKREPRISAGLSARTAHSPQWKEVRKGKL